jgi:hypothetical protein
VAWLKVEAVRDLPLPARLGGRQALASRGVTTESVAPTPANAEAAILSHLNHPAIIRHLESFEHESHLCIVTEFAERGDLTGRLEERKGVPLREEQVLDYFVQMCLSLLYLHKKKILHRDLKLANVFLSADNQVKLGGAWRQPGEGCSDRPQKMGLSSRQPAHANVKRTTLWFAA